jgi:hypothetical protein
MYPRRTDRPKFRSLRLALLWVCAGLLTGLSSRAGEPDAKSYWDVKDLRPGMTGVGRTVMVGSTLEEFGVEVLGVLRGVSPGRDMVLCRLKGCNLEHAGIIQGMSGSPVYIDGKLVGAVAFAWEFAKDPIAGVTPFSEMVAYVRSNDRRLAAEPAEHDDHALRAARLDTTLWDRDALLPSPDSALSPPHSALRVSGGGLAGMQPIATPLAATGFSPRALAILQERLGPLGLTAAPGGGALDDLVEREGARPLVPGAPVSVGLVTGDFDLSGIGTVTHVEGDRVYAFGHPMMGLGACELPMMTGWIHTVYPRASVSMKLGSPLKTVGVLDTDVSTAVSGRLGPKPDMLPMSVRVVSNHYAEPHTYRVALAREPNLLPTLVLTVLASAIDTEGNLPDELTARIEAEIKLAGHEPVVVRETLSGPRYAGPNGPMALFASVASTVQLLARNPIGAVRIEAIDCRIELERTRQLAEIESLRLASDRVEPGQPLRAIVTLKPYKGERRSIGITLPLPDDLPEGTYEVSVNDVNRSLQRRFRNAPGLLEPKSLEALLALLRGRTEPTRTALYLHVPRPGRGLSVVGQAMPDLPGGVRAVLSSPRETAGPPVREDLVAAAETAWVIEGSQAVNFTVVKDRGVAEPEGR